MASGVPPMADKVSVIREQRSDDRRQMKNCKMKRPFCPLFSILCHPFTDTRHLKPFLLKKKIITSDPYFVNYLQDATLYGTY
jgi:hypothetical protein